MLDYFLLKTLTSKLSRQKEPKGYGNFKYFVREKGSTDFFYLSTVAILFLGLGFYHFSYLSTVAILKVTWGFVKIS
jgi:hypothetical protein